MAAENELQGLNQMAHRQLLASPHKFKGPTISPKTREGWGTPELFCDYWLMATPRFKARYAYWGRGCGNRCHDAMQIGVHSILLKIVLG